MVCAGFDNTHVVFGSEAEERERHTDVVVEVPLRIDDVVVFSQHCRGEFLRGGFPVCACYGYHINIFGGSSEYIRTYLQREHSRERGRAFPQQS